VSEVVGLYVYVAAIVLVAAALTTGSMDTDDDGDEWGGLGKGTDVVFWSRRRDFFGSDVVLQELALTAGSVDADDGDDDGMQDKGTTAFLPLGISIASRLAGGRKGVCGVTPGTLIAGVTVSMVFLSSMEGPTEGGVSKLIFVFNRCTRA
jgi:hypothetical protein